MAYKTERDIKNRTVPDKLLAKLSYVASPTPTPTPTVTVTPSSTPSNGKLWTWGKNVYGQLGDGTVTSRSSPVQVGSGGGWKEVGGVTRSDTDVGMGAAIKYDGTLWTWGYNGNGNLGLGDTTNRSSPVQVGTATDWVSVAVSIGAIIALKGSDPTANPLYCVGGGDTGNGDNGLTVAVSAPTLISPVGPYGYSFTQVAANFLHCLAISANGWLWGWGRNGNGQLGLNNLTDPKYGLNLINNTAQWSLIAVGNYHSILGNGVRVYSTGNNNHGQLGQGINDTTQRSVFTQIGTDTTWTGPFACGDNHTLAIKQGALWVFGKNNLGQLGTGNTTQYQSPVQVGTATTWSKVYAHRDTSFAIKTDGSIWGWGDNASGQIGDGTTTTRSSPVQIGSLTTWSKLKASAIGIKS